MFKLYRNSFCRQKAGLEPVLELQGRRISPSRFSIPLLKFSDSHTKIKIPGHLDKKVVGNCNHYITPAKVSTNLRRRPFLSFFSFWSKPGFGRKFAKFRTRFRRNLFLFFWSSPGYEWIRLIAVALWLRLLSAAKASPHATFYGLNAG